MSCWSTKIDKGGRVVVPAEVRRTLGVAAGDEVLVEVEDGEVRLTARAAARRRAQARVARHFSDKESLVDELLAWRRQEAGRE